MSDVVATTDPPLPSEPAPAGRSRRFAPILSLVRRLIDYGRQLAASLQQPNPDADLHRVASDFGTYDLGRIVASIIRGLHRAAALETRLVPLAACPDPARKPASARLPRAATATTPRKKPAAAAVVALTPKEIAERVRRQPIGVVLADICRDLGIRRGHKLWDELHQAIVMHNGGAIRLWKEIMGRPWLNPITRQPYTQEELRRPLYPPRPAPAGTGPP